MYVSIPCSLSYHFRHSFIPNVASYPTSSIPLHLMIVRGFHHSFCPRDCTIVLHPRPLEMEGFDEDYVWVVCSRDRFLCII
jgi:hypothetical protein